MSERRRHRPAVLPPPPPATEQVPLATEHTHPLPRAFVWAGAALVVLTLAGILLLAAYAYSITARLSQVEAYIADRGQLRDEQAAQLRTELGDAVCDVLDRLPPDTPALEPLRGRYGCGPGTPFEETP